MAKPVTIVLPKPKEALETKGGKLREILGLDYTKISNIARESWTPDLRREVRKVARKVGAILAEKWETDEELSRIAGALHEEFFDKVKMDPFYRKMLKASRFKAHYRDGRIVIIALPTRVEMKYAHKLRTGTKRYGVGGFVAEYRRTDEGLQLIKVHYSGYDPEKIAEAVKELDPSLFDRARNKLGFSLGWTLEQLGVKTS